jgi:hypothetical protein
VLAVDFGRATGAGRSFIDRFHRHGRIDLRELVALVRVPGFEIIESGAIGMRDLNFVLARVR